MEWQYISINSLVSKTSWAISLFLKLISKLLFSLLTTIILDRTNISLQIRKSSVHTINYLRSTGNLELNDCTNLTNLQLTSSNINECKILPGWSNKININNNIIKLYIVQLNTRWLSIATGECQQQDSICIFLSLSGKEKLL